MEILYIAKTRSRIASDGALYNELTRLGNLTVIENASALGSAEIIEKIMNCNILLTMHESVRVPVEIAVQRGKLEYICHLTGTVREFIPIEVIDAGIPVTNWGDSPANALAEGAMALLLSTLKDLHAQIDTVREGGWRLDPASYPGGTLKGLHLGIYGFGVIGRRFAEMANTFMPVIRVYDPYVKDLPEYCRRVDSLAELFSQSQAVAVHAALCEETTGSITKELLALLPDKAIVINTARGEIFDQAALFSELESGRLRAGLDVLAEDSLNIDHAARGWKNCIITPHNIGRAAGGFAYKDERGLIDRERICVDNIQRFLSGKPLQFSMDRTRYLRST